MLRYVIRAQESVILDDASVSNQFETDEYFREKHARSVLCLPLVKQATLIGVLYLENNLAPYAFTPSRVEVLKLLASQAAISLENARLYADLQHTQTYLSEAQRLSQTGSFGWNVTSGELFWSDEMFRIYGFDRKTKPEVEMVIQRSHPEDIELVRGVVDSAQREGNDLDFEYRALMPDGSSKAVHVVARAIQEESGKLRYVGTVIDVTASRRAEEALRASQATLMHAARLTTMGELVVSIAHELNQPLMAIVTNAETCLQWLSGANPDLEEARKAAERVIRNGHRAGDVIASVRALVRKSSSGMTRLDMNGMITEILDLMRAEIRCHEVVLSTELLPSVEPVWADRVQIEQVLVNLIMNAVEAMSLVVDRPRTLRISSESDGDNVLVAIADSGPGIELSKTDQIFEAFFTTKPEGLGMGLSICRSILEATSRAHMGLAKFATWQHPAVHASGSKDRVLR